MKIISEGKTNSIEYNGKNHDEIKNLINKSKFKIKVEFDQSNGLKLNNSKVLKDDTVSIEKDGVYITKPSYQGNKKTKVSK